MWKCHKCGKPVYFAERKQSLGYDWHPECLRCEECGKRLNPGQHAEHKGVPYCHVPCYGALFGPQLFGHGTRVESHKNFGQKGIQRVNGGAPALPRDHLESKLKLYNQFYDNKSLEVRSREVNNRLILEGALRVYWGVQGVIHLKEDDDQRTVAVRKRNSGRYSTSAIEQDNSDKENEIDASESIEPPTTTTTTGLIDDFSTDISLSESMTFDSCSLNEYPLSEEATTPTTPTATQSTITTNTGSTSSTLPSKLDNLNSLEWDEIDDLLQVERRYNEKDKIYETMPVKLPSSQSSSDSSPTKSASEKSSSTTTETSSDNFITASASIGTTTATTTTTSETNNETTDDDETLKPMDFEDFKRSIHQEYVNGTNDFLDINDDTLKKNQPIDPSRINDSLKLYGENAMSKSFNCEQALRTIDPAMINDTLCRRVVSGVEHSSARNYALQKSGSASSNHYHGKSLFEKGINRSKSGPTCFEFTDSEEESSTLKQSKPVTIRRSQPRYINIRMDCYPNQSDNDTSASKAVDTNSFSAAGELTTTETYVNGQHLHVTENGVVLRRPPKTGSTAIKRRSGNKRSRTKLKRRCSINGHFYNRETSFFTPPYGSQMSVWVTSLVTTQEVINLVLEKYKVDSPAENFSLFIVRDNGEQKRLKELDYPLVVRIMLGPHEDVARLFLMDAQKTQEISNEVAQFINLSIPECRAILDRYDDELDREIAKVREKYAELRRRITSRMESLKVRL